MALFVMQHITNPAHKQNTYLISKLGIYILLSLFAAPTSSCPFTHAYAFNLPTNSSHSYTHDIGLKPAYLYICVHAAICVLINLNTAAQINASPSASPATYTAAVVAAAHQK
eukprot:gene9269-1545_t